MEINFDNNKHITYDAAGNERIEEKNTTNSAFANDLEEAQKESNKTNSVFANSTEEAREASEEIKEEKKSDDELLEELMFMYKTGMSKEDFDKLQDLLKEVQDKIKDGNYSVQEVTEMLNEVEKEIQRIKKEMTGEAVKELTSSLGELAENIKSNPEKANDIVQQLLDKVKEAQANIASLEKGQDKSGHGKGNTAEKLELVQKLKQAI